MNTVLPHSVAHTLVVTPQGDVKAAATAIAVEEIVSSTDSAYAAGITVKNTFLDVLVVVERANVAEVRGEVLVASSARLRLELDFVATEALNVSNLVTIQLVAELLRLACITVMAEPTGVELLVARGVWAAELACSTVVLAAETALGSFIVRGLLAQGGLLLPDTDDSFYFAIHLSY